MNTSGSNHKLDITRSDRSTNEGASVTYCVNMSCTHRELDFWVPKNFMVSCFWQLY